MKRALFAFSILAMNAQPASAELVNINLSGVVIMTTHSCAALDPQHPNNWTALPNSEGSYVRGISADTGDHGGTNTIAQNNLPTLPETQSDQSFVWSGGSIAPYNSDDPDASVTLFRRRPHIDSGFPLTVNERSQPHQDEFHPQYVALNMCVHRDNPHP